MTTKVIDYLFEDPVITGQKYALVSIVGPHLKQKCDVWGLKVRGVAESLDQCKEMTKKLMKIDNNYDIYNVEVGKFFPLNVDPFDVKNIEYENEQLNSLVKGYLENKEKANEHWAQRKQEMISEAIREGSSQEELQNKIEHPIAVLKRINDHKEQLKSLQEQLAEAQKKFDMASEKYNGYTEEQRLLAENELADAISQELKNLGVSESSEDTQKTIEDIRNEIVNELKDE